jgi:hypothetical protein
MAQGRREQPACALGGCTRRQRRRPSRSPAEEVAATWPNPHTRRGDRRRPDRIHTQGAVAPWPGPSRGSGGAPATWVPGRGLAREGRRRPGPDLAHGGGGVRRRE